MTSIEELRALEAAATPGPWVDNGYSAIFSSPMIEADDAFWTEERYADGHTYDHRVGQTCPACGERPAIYGDSAKPEVRGQRFGTYWDCVLHKDAYEVEPVVASVPAEYGDTATGRHRADAAFIAAARNALPDLLDRLERAERQVAAALEQVAHLDLTAQQLREQGDVGQVLLTEDGVDEGPSLADELWLIAYNLRAALATEEATP